MAEIKTKPTSESVEDFLNKVENEQKRKDSFTILEMMKNTTGEEPRMWGSSLIGFGNVIIKSDKTNREVNWFILGFSPRKANISLYLGTDIQLHAESLKKLGKHKTGVGCLYINKLSDINLDVLNEMIISAAIGK
ncbi:MAG: DUF1801 domain-containing protein [Bacteroidales bacterium]|jgi:formylmethanofuran dehydrogenase subunit A|nr:DUF1801 domain-containing protein [Bacteroidales bacterium]